MTKKEILEMTGLSEEEFYRQYPTQESWTESYKKGGWIQKATASIKRRGTEGVCTGSKFGGPTCRPGTKRYNLAKTFRKMAKSRKEEGGYVDMYEDGGQIPDEVLRSRLEAHMSPEEATQYLAKREDGGMVDSYGSGGYTVRRSNDRKGKTHVVIGPDGTKKYFGDPNMGQREDSEHGKEAFYARHAKNLKNNPYFRAYARATWEDGGTVDVYQLMGMPTPAMYGMGGTTNIGDLSHVISAKNFPNMGYAMGGQVNYPQGLRKNMGNMPIFAMGGYSEMTEGELEHGENLNVNRNGRWRTVTKYESGGMGRHSQNGTPKPNQNVPLPVGASIASRRFKKLDDLAENTNDKLLKEALHGKVITAKTGGYVGSSYAEGGPVNGELRFPGMIEIAKMKKEAAEEQAATTAYNKFAKKYGGAIRRMYAKGGMVPMYDLGGETGGLNINNPAFNNNNFSFTNPNSSFSGSMDFLGTPNSLNLDYSPMTMGQYRTGQTGSYMDYRNIPDTGIGYKGTDTPPSDSNNFNYKDFMSQAIPYGVAASQVIEPLLQKPFKMKSQDYETPADLKWRELTGESGRRDLERARAGMQYTVRNIGGSNALAALTGGANEYYRNVAAYNEALENKNRMGQSEIDRANKAIQQSNLSQRMQIAMFNEQNRAARRNAIRQGVMNTAGTYYNQQANQITKEGLSAAYPDYMFPWSKKKSS